MNILTVSPSASVCLFLTDFRVIIHLKLLKLGYSPPVLYRSAVAKSSRWVFLFSISTAISLKGGPGVCVSLMSSVYQSARTIRKLRCFVGTEGLGAGQVVPQ